VTIGDQLKYLLTRDGYQESSVLANPSNTRLIDPDTTTDASIIMVSRADCAKNLTDPTIFEAIENGLN
jgi:hypothetical protein